MDPITSYILKGFTPAVVTFPSCIRFTLCTVLLPSAHIHGTTPIGGGNSFDLKLPQVASPFLSTLLHQVYSKECLNLLSLPLFLILFEHTPIILLHPLLHWNCSCQSYSIPCCQIQWPVQSPHHSCLLSSSWQLISVPHWKAFLIWPPGHQPPLLLLPSLLSSALL